MSDEELKSELERLRNENAALKKGASTGIRTPTAARHWARRGPGDLGRRNSRGRCDGGHLGPSGRDPALIARNAPGITIPHRKYRRCLDAMRQNGKRTHQSRSRPPSRTYEPFLAPAAPPSSANDPADPALDLRAVTLFSLGPNGRRAWI